MSTLPEHLAGLFHRYRWECLDVNRHSDIIIPAVLQWGSWEQIRWLFATYGWDKIRDWVAKDAVTLRSLPESVQVFWTTVLLGEPIYYPVSPEQRWAPTRKIPDDAGPEWLRKALERLDFPEPQPRPGKRTECSTGDGGAGVDVADDIRA